GARGGGASGGGPSGVGSGPRGAEPLPLRGVTEPVLVASSRSGWAETELAGLVRAPAGPDPHDAPGPASIAVAAERPADGARLVVFGSARSFTSGAPATGALGNQALA